MELRTWLAEISDLRHAAAVLQWDKQTKMPALGSDARTDQIETLERITHERFVSQHTLELIEAAEAEQAERPAAWIDARSLSEARRLFDKGRRVPVELAAARAKAASNGYKVWVAAREANDFAAFAAALEHNFQLTRDYVACFDDYEHPYDVVIDDFAPGMRTSQAAGLLGEMRDQLLPLILAARDRPGAAARALSGRRPTSRRRSGARLDGLRGRQLAPGRHRASVRDELRGHGHPHHHALRRKLFPDGTLRRQARVRSRSIRGWGRPQAVANAAGYDPLELDP